MAPSGRTHASFPQLKYPSLRDGVSKDATQWLEGKVLDDGAENLWRIHGGLYDLGDFITRHPGGRDWIELTKGTDITEAFECHHITEKPEKLLPQFFVRNAKTVRNSPFTFEDDGFFRTLKRRLRKDLDKVELRCYEWKSEAIMDGLLGTVLTLTPIACMVDSNLILALTLILAGLALAYCVICSHNFFHKKDNWRMYIWNLSTSSYREWRVTHALSHHIFTNTIMDVEISVFEPFLFMLPEAKPFYHLLVIVYLPVVYAFTFWFQSLRKIVLALTKEEYFMHHVFWHDLLPLALPLWMLVVSGASINRVLLTWIAIITIASIIFSFIGLTAGHHHPEVFHDGDEPNDTSLDWGLHQLDAVMDNVGTKDSLFRVLTTYGDHALHHLFPTIDHAVIPMLYHSFYEVCEEYGTTHKISTSLDLTLGHFRQLYRTKGRIKLK